VGTAGFNWTIVKAKQIAAKMKHEEKRREREEGKVKYIS
jgi:hypothetical protein